MYPQSMLWSKNKKNRYTPVYPSFAIIKVGFKGVYITRTCFHSELLVTQRGTGTWHSASRDTTIMQHHKYIVSNQLNVRTAMDFTIIQEKSTWYYIRAASWENQQCGFRTGPTQTGLYKQRRARSLKFRI